VATLNGAVTVDRYKGGRRLEGFIGVQSHDDDSQIAFRSIAISEL
jgi:hypothetical protein